jgi:ABC-type transport system involved in multi-copper enzyme maturation permease subunit
MIWKIAKKEFLLNLMTFKFAVGTILCVVLMVVFMPVLIREYQKRLGQYSVDVAANEAELRKVKVFRSITPTIYRPPNVLSVFSEGLEKRLGNSAEINPCNVKLAEYNPPNVYEIKTIPTETNPLLSIFPVLDISLIFEIVISVMALLVAYDTISGERENGTLKLILSNTVSRSQVLLGKVVAGLITLLVPVTIAFITGLLILLLFPMVNLTETDWLRIGLMYFVSLVFTSVMYNIGMLFSCIARKSAISLMLGLFLWIIFVALIPNGSIYLASSLRPIELTEKFDAQGKALQDKHEREIDELSKTLTVVGKRGGRRRRGAFGWYYYPVCSPTFMESQRKYNKIIVPQKIKHADEIWELQQGYFSNLMKQNHLAATIARSSPVTIYRNLMSVLSGTDLGNFEHFMKCVKAYKIQVAEYIRAETKNFSLPSYFTPCKEGDWEEHEEMSKRRKEAQAQNKAERVKASETYRKWEKKKIEQTPSVISQDFPQFIYHTQNLLTNIHTVATDLALLIFVVALFFVLSFVAFLKYDVR